MEWLFVKPLTADGLISEYEERVGYIFPDDFKEFIRQNNGGRPKNKCFYSYRGKSKRKRVFNNLLSFNKEDITSIWRYNDWQGSDWFKFSGGEIENYIEFAGDPFGDPICFDKRTNEIVWIDHEQIDFSIAVESVAKSFTQLINSLKSK